MARVVKVDLVLEASRYLRGARDAETVTDKLADSVEDAGRAGERASESTDRLSGELGDLARDARRLDSQIDETKRGIRDLAREIARTSDEAKRAELSKKLNVEQRGLRRQTKLRDLIDIDSAEEAGDGAAESFSARFVQRIGPLVASAPMGPAGAAIGAAVAVVAVPTIAAAISGAVVGGVGIGGVIGGVKLAAQDARVQAAGKQLGENLIGDLEDSASRFVDPVVSAIGEIQQAWNDVSGDIDSALAASSRYVEPLAEGISNFVRELGPGIRDAAEAAGPIIDVLAEELPEVGAEISDMLSTMAGDADEGASALRLIFRILEEGIAVTAGTIHLFTEFYRTLVGVADAGVTVADAVYGWMPGAGPQIDSARDKVNAMKGDLEGAGNTGGEAGAKIEGGIRKVDTAAAVAAVKVESLSDAVRRMTGENISAEQANIRLGDAIDDAMAAAKENGKTVDSNTAKGRANRSALIGIAQAANASAEAVFKQTGSQELASDASARGRAAFLRAASAMGISAGEAARLADKLFAIPAKRSTTVTVNAAQASAAISALKARIASIDRRIDIKAVMTTSYAGSYHSGQGYTSGQRWGGAYEHAQTGLLRLRDAGIYSPAGPARYAFAEPATGGEAFVPKYGDPRRSLGILDQAASWYGATVRPQMAPAMVAAGGGATVVNHYHQWTVNVPPTVNKAEVGREVVRAVQEYERGNGSGWRR